MYKLTVQISRKQYKELRNDLHSLQNYVQRCEGPLVPGEDVLLDISFAIPLDDYELFVEACHSRSIVIGPA